MPKGTREKHQVDYRRRTIYPYCHALAARRPERIASITQDICADARDLSITLAATGFT
jgi:hypothetical protein